MEHVQLEMPTLRASTLSSLILIVKITNTPLSQCAMQSRKCEYPTISRCGLHKHHKTDGGHHDQVGPEATGSSTSSSVHVHFT